MPDACATSWRSKKVSGTAEYNCDGSNDGPYLPTPPKAETAPSLHGRPSQFRIGTSLDDCGYEGCIVCFGLECFQRPRLFLSVCRKPIWVCWATLEQVGHDDQAWYRGGEKICAAKGGLAEAKGIEDSDDGAGGRFRACDVFDGGEVVSGTIDTKCNNLVASLQASISPSVP